MVCGVGCGLIRFLVRALGAGSRVVLGGSRSSHGGSGGFSVRSGYGFFCVVSGGFVWRKGFGVGWVLHVLSFLPLGILTGLIACGHLAARSSHAMCEIEWIGSHHDSHC